MTARPLLPRPPVGPPPRWRFPAAEVVTLDNGLEVWNYDLPGQPIVSATLANRVGLEAEPRDREGVATLTARVLDEGTHALPGDAFAERLEGQGAALNAGTSLAGTQVLLDVPASRVEVALPMLADAVVSPRLDAADVERQVTIRLAEIEQARAQSSATAGRVFARRLFDDAYRGARLGGGEPETVARVVADDVAAFHARVFAPATSTLVIGGDLGGRGVRLAEAAFGGWRAEAPAPPPVPRPTALAPTAVVVDRPGAVAADLRLGGLGPDRRDPAWPAFTVASYVMGGAFLSRLNQVLREERGYTYGVGLHPSPHRRGGSFAVAGSFRTDVLAPAVAEARRLLDPGPDGFTAEELRDAVSYLTGVSPLRFATADGVVDQAVAQAMHGLGTDYFNRLSDALRAVTPDEATARYREFVDPARLTLVVVGDAAVLAPALAAEGIEAEVID